MATFTITTAQNIDELTSKGGGDTYNINGGTLTIDQDSRVGLNQTSSAALGNITISASLGGTIRIDGRKIRLVPYDGGSGTIPAWNSTVTQGSASGKLIGVYSSLTSDSVATGGSLPSSGWLKIKQWNDVAFTDNQSITLSGCTLTVNGTDTAGWLEIVADDGKTLTAGLRSTVEFLGEWYELGTTSGSANQTFQIPNNGRLRHIGGIFVETGTGTGSFTPYPNVGHMTLIASANTSTDICTSVAHGLQTGERVKIVLGTLVGPTNNTDYYINRVAVDTFKLYDTYNNSVTGGATGLIDITTSGTATLYSRLDIATDVRGKVCFIDQTGLVTLGYNGAANAGYVPASGRRVVIGNVFLEGCTTADRTVNTSHITPSSRYYFTCSNGPTITLTKITSAWYNAFSYATSVPITNCSFLEYLSLVQIINALSISGVAIGNWRSQAGVNYQIYIALCQSGGTVTNLHSCMPQINQYNACAIYLNTISDIAFTTCTGSCGRDRLGSLSAWQLSSCNDLTFTTCGAIGHCIYISGCTGLTWTNTSYADSIKATAAKADSNHSFSILGSVDIDFNGIDFYGVDPSSVGPYFVMYTTTSSGLKFRNMGSRTAAIDCNNRMEGWKSGQYAVYDSNNVKFQRLWLKNTKNTNWGWFDNASYSELFIDNCGGDAGDLILFTVRNGAIRGFYGTVSTSSATVGASGSHFYDCFTSTTAGRIGIFFNPKTTWQYSANAYEVITNGGSVGFTGGGGLYLPSVNDQIVWTWQWYILGHEAFSASEAVMGGGTLSNFQLRYQIDKNDGNGYSGWRNLYRRVGNAATTNTSAIVTFSGGTTTANLAVGDYVWGTNIATGARIQSIDSSTQITLSAASTGTGSGLTLRFNHLPYETTESAISATNGFKLKVELTCTTANTETITSLYFPTTTTTTSIDAGLYPLDVSTVDVNIDGLVAGSQVKIVRTSDDYEYYNSTIAGTTVSFQTDITEDTPIEIYVRKASAAPYYQPLYATGTITLTAGFTATLTQIPDSIAGSYPAGIASDFTVNTGTKTITHTSGSTVYSVNELYSYLAGYFDSSTTVDLDIPMTAATSTVFTLTNGYTMSDASHEYLNGGAITEASGDTLWANIYTIGSITSGTQLYVIQNGTRITPWWSTGHIDVLIKVKSGGSFIDSGNVRVFARKFNSYYDHYLVDLSGGGRNVIPLATSTDLDNQTAGATVAGYSDITITQSAQLAKQIDVNDTAGDYTWKVDGAGRTVQQIYEYLKYIVRQGSTYSLQSKDGEQYRTLNASFAEIKTAPFGTIAGGVFFGAKGLWLENVSAGDALNYVLTDDAGVTHQASSTIAIGNIVSGSRLYVYDSTNTTELYNDIVVGTTASIPYSGGSGSSLIIKARQMGYKTYETSGTTTATGLSITLDQESDPVATTYPVGIASDFSINTATKEITHIAGTTVYTVRQFHSYWVDLFAGETYMQYDVPTAAYTNYEFEIINSYTIPTASLHQYLKTGSIIEDGGDTLYGNLYTVGSLDSNNNVYITQSSTKITAWWGTGNIDILIKVKEAGALIASGVLEVFVRDFNYLFDHGTVTITEGGRNPVPLVSGADINNETSAVTVAGYSDISITEGATSKDVGDGGGAQPYSVIINGAGRTVTEIYEYLKYITRRTSAYTLRSDNGEEYIRINDSYAEVKPPFGTLAGGRFFGARGVWLENMSDSDVNNYELIDNNNVQRVPPTQIQILITGIADGSRIQVYDVTADSEIANEIVSGTSYSYLTNYWGTDHTIRVRLAYVSGVTAKEWYTTTGTATNTGLSINVAQVDNTVYSTNNINGSNVTECSISGTTVRIYVDDPDNTTSGQRIYNWYQYILFTEAGIRDQDGGYVSATDTTHYVFDNSMKIINQDTANPLNITGANIVPTSGPATNIFDLSNGASIALNFNRVEGFAYSSGSGLSTEEHDRLMALPTTNTGLTLGQYIALK